MEKINKLHTSESNEMVNKASGIHFIFKYRQFTFIYSVWRSRSRLPLLFCFIRRVFCWPWLISGAETHFIISVGYGFLRAHSSHGLLLSHSPPFPSFFPILSPRIRSPLLCMWTEHDGLRLRSVTQFINEIITLKWNSASSRCPCSDELRSKTEHKKLETRGKKC